MTKELVEIKKCTKITIIMMIITMMTMMITVSVMAPAATGYPPEARRSVPLSMVAAMAARSGGVDRSSALMKKATTATRRLAVAVASCSRLDGSVT